MNTRSFIAISLALATLALGGCSRKTTTEMTEVYHSKEKDTSLFISYKGHSLTAHEHFQAYHHLRAQHQVALWEKGYKKVPEASKSNRYCEMHVSYRGSKAQVQIQSFNCREENNGGSFQDALDQLS